MPLKRTPPIQKPDQQNLSETDTESVGGGMSEPQRITHPGRMKRKRESDLLGFMDDIRGMFKEFVADQDVKMQNLQASLTEIKSQNDSMSLSMELLAHKYDEMQNELECIRQVRKEQESYIKKLETRIENFERQSNASKLEIRGIPTLHNESKQELCNVVGKLCKSLNFDVDNSHLRDIYRAPAKLNASRPVVVEFTSVSTKETIINSFKRIGQRERVARLNTGLLGFASPHKPIFISESLTPKGRRLFFLARDFARSHDFAFCWISYGKIYLRKNEGAPHIRVDEEADLAELRNKSSTSTAKW